MWNAGEARDRLSELFRRALSEGPQYVKRRDDVAVLISKAEYDRLVQASREPADPEPSP